MTNTANIETGRRATLLVLATIVALIIFGGAALAASKACETGIDCFGTNKADFLKGSIDFDYVYGRGGGDTVKGLGGNDELYGQGGPDRLLGGPKFDQLIGGPANDKLSGGEDTDRYYFYTDWGRDTITDDTTSANQLYFREGPNEPGISTDDLTIRLVSGEGPEVRNASGQANINWNGNVISLVLSGSGDDRITGNSLDNDIYPHTGIDTVFGGAGDDFIDVGDGSGDDVVDCGEDFLGSDDDAVQFDVGDQIAENCEIQELAT